MNLDRDPACDLALISTLFHPARGTGQIIKSMNIVWFQLITFAKPRIKGPTEFREVVVSGKTWIELFQLFLQSL